MLCSDEQAQSSGQDGTPIRAKRPATEGYFARSIPSQRHLQPSGVTSFYARTIAFNVVYRGSWKSKIRRAHPGRSGIFLFIHIESTHLCLFTRKYSDFLPCSGFRFRASGKDKMIRGKRKQTPEFPTSVFIILLAAITGTAAQTRGRRSSSA